MPEGVGYGPQFTASTGLSLNYIGNRAFAYSGEVSVDDTETNLLDFQSGKELLVARIIFAYGTPAQSDDFLYKIYLNGLAIMGQLFSAANEAGQHTEYKIIIPPLTHVVTSADNVSSSNPKSQFCIFTGKIIK